MGLPECSSSTKKCFVGLPEYSSSIKKCFAGLPECSSSTKKCFVGLPEYSSSIKKCFVDCFAHPILLFFAFRMDFFCRHPSAGKVLDALNDLGIARFEIKDGKILVAPLSSSKNGD